MPKAKILLGIAIVIIVFIAGWYAADFFGSSNNQSSSDLSGNTTSTRQITERCAGTPIANNYTFTIREGMAPHIFRLFKNKASENDAAEAVTCVEVSQNGDVIQLMKDFESESFVLETADADTLFASRDANFDGYADVELLAGMGATGNTWYNFWLFEPTSGQFVWNEDLNILISPQFKSQSRQITSFAKAGCAGLCWDESSYMFENGKLVMVRQVTQGSNSDGTFTKVTKERRNGALEVVSTHTLTLEEATQ